jgi:hypothetical protein
MLKSSFRHLVMTATLAPLVLASSPEKELGESLKARYKGARLSIMVPGFYAGEFKKAMTAREDFVNWRHYHESVPLKREKKVLDQLDERTLAFPPTLGGNGLGSNILPIEKGESLVVSNVLFGCFRGQCFLTLFLDTSKLSKTKGLDPLKETRDVTPVLESAGLGCEFQFIFAREAVEQTAAEDLVTSTVAKYLQRPEEAARSLKAQRDIEIDIGATEEEVTAKLGEPEKTIRVGPQKTLKYPDMTIVLKDGKVVDVDVK